MVNLVLIIMILTIHCFDLEVRKTLKWPDSRGKELNPNQSGDTIQVLVIGKYILYNR